MSSNKLAIEKVSLAEYARHKGLSIQTVRDAIDQGQIKAEKRGHNVFIDQAQADIDWANNRATRADKSADGQGYAAERAKREHANAELALLELEEKRGSLVSIARVEKEGFEVARSIRDALLNIPQKIAPEVAAETDPHAVEIILQREIQQALEAVTKIVGAG